MCDDFLHCSRSSQQSESGPVSTYSLLILSERQRDEVVVPPRRAPERLLVRPGKALEELEDLLVVAGEDRRGQRPFEHVLEVARQLAAVVRALADGLVLLAARVERLEQRLREREDVGDDGVNTGARELGDLELLQDGRAVDGRVVAAVGQEGVEE